MWNVQKLTIQTFFQVDLTANHSEIARNGLRRLWGVPDTSAYVGHLFRMEIPKEAFSGEVSAYKVITTYLPYIIWKYYLE